MLTMEKVAELGGSAILKTGQVQPLVDVRADVSPGKPVFILAESTGASTYSLTSSDGGESTVQLVSKNDPALFWKKIENPDSQISFSFYTTPTFSQVRYTVIQP